MDKYPDMKLIMAPTTVGIVAAAKAMQDEGLCDKVKVSRPGPAGGDGGVHHERLRAGVRAVELRRPRLPDLLHRLPARHRRRSRARKASSFDAGRMGDVHHRRRTRPATTGLRVLMGPFTVYNKDNVEAAAKRPQ